jgi:hypothetical protein
MYITETKQLPKKIGSLDSIYGIRLALEIMTCGDIGQTKLPQWINCSCQKALAPWVGN